MMRDAVINVGVAQRGSGVARLLGLLVVVGGLVALLWAAASALAAAEQAVMLQDAGYRAATARAQIAQADLETAKAEHDAASIRHSEAIEASWDPITAGVVHVVGLGLLVGVSLVVLLAAGLLLRRHLSLPTRDGRVAIVGLDRELSREALIRYQLRELAGMAAYEARPSEREVHQGSPGRRLEVLSQGEDEDRS
jgi:hypothetical protein